MFQGRKSDGVHGRFETGFLQIQTVGLFSGPFHDELAKEVHRRAESQHTFGQAGQEIRVFDQTRPNGLAYIMKKVLSVEQKTAVKRKSGGRTRIQDSALRISDCMVSRQGTVFDLFILDYVDDGPDYFRVLFLNPFPRGQFSLDKDLFPHTLLDLHHRLD